ncbi:IclR family transcriptional regulator [Pseudooceanicola nanhaiensis]|uniref:IclR family transcriptional regulator n=1 Tax=Pseudooceanicola nanhaiensis TaxID=375761 RepID=UPI001CD3C59E|nr:helix-turn-helix domain-containing protein [Pseudooceanicola nanhaiensis]MCA0921306.1 helix-turn-helix domain-containing protein [Pseudooceanicola nanhaiensis]
MTDSEKSGEKSGGIQVIARAAAILRLMGDHPQGLSLSAIAGEVGLARSTVQRIIHALEMEGLAEPSGPSGGFRLGPSLSQLVYRRQMDIVGEVRPHLEALCAELGESLSLCGISGDKLNTLDRAIAEQPLRVVFPLGTIPHPVWVLAPGRAILAEWPVARARAVLAQDMPPDEVEAELDILAAQRDGALDKYQINEGLIAFAVPLRTHMGLYSLAAILPTQRAEQRGDDILAALRRRRDLIEASLGAAGAD